MLHFAVVTLFASLIDSLRDAGITRRALLAEKLQLTCFNPRDYAKNPHKRVDDRPFGGGPGMVMCYQPLKDAINAAQSSMAGKAKVIYLSPQGQTFNQRVAEQLAHEENIILLAGRYEGIDERIIENHVDVEYSIGDYILTGGELAAMVVIDAVTRLLPGVLGNAASKVQESFQQGLLEHPQYTRPESIDGYRVPDILLSGDHDAIARWRAQQAQQRTDIRRPDLLPRPGLLKDK